MSEIPSVKVYETITPTNSGTGEPLFVYPQLAPAVNEYRLSNTVRAAIFWDSEQGSLEEIKAAKQLAMYYLLGTALKGVEAASTSAHDIWAERFTQASIELHGAPEITEVKKIMNNDLRQFQALEDNPNVDQSLLQFLKTSYATVLGPAELNSKTEYESTDRTYEQAAITAYGDVLREKYQPVFDLVDQSGKETFMPEDLGKLFTEALHWLADTNDPTWDLWKVVYTDRSSLNVGGKEREIKIGKRRQAVTPSVAKKLLAHELFVHALRSQNAHQSNDTMLLKGLPDFLDAEEGLGKVSEAAISGEFDEPGRDRYLDIAFAVGTVDGIQKTRPELFQIRLARDMIKAQASGEFDESMMPKLTRGAWSAVDRVYRGGKGSNIGSKQAVFTKDIVYYTGYKKIVIYLSRQLASGKTMLEVFDYLAAGSFDPTNPRHVERLA